MGKSTKKPEGKKGVGSIVKVLGFKILTSKEILKWVEKFTADKKVRGFTVQAYYDIMADAKKYIESSTEGINRIKIIDLDLEVNGNKIIFSQIVGMGRIKIIAIRGWETFSKEEQKMLSDLRSKYLVLAGKEKETDEKKVAPKKETKKTVPKKDVVKEEVKKASPKKAAPKKVVSKEATKKRQPKKVVKK